MDDFTRRFNRQKRQAEKKAQDGFEVPDPATNVAARAVAKAKGHELGEWVTPPPADISTGKLYYSASAHCRKCGEILLVSKSGSYGRFQGIVPRDRCIVPGSFDDLMAEHILESTDEADALDAVSHKAY